MTIRVSLAFLLGVLLAVPFVSNAAKLTTGSESCTPVYEECTCNQRKNPKTGKCVTGINRFQCQCDETPPGGHVTAICVHKLDCKGTGTEKGGIGDSKGMMDALKGIMDMLKQAMQGGEKPPPPPPPPPPDAGKQGCAQYYQVTTPSTDPCANYVPPTSSSLLSGSQTGVTSDLLNALGGGAGSGLMNALSGEGEEGGSASSGNVSDLLLGGLSDDTEVDEEVSATSSATSTQGLFDTGGIGGQGVNITSGTRGNIEITGTGATVVAGARDAEANTEVAGFYGSNAPGGQPQGVVSKMCKNRPWAESIVTYVIPPSFFDSLCAWRGYQVGTPEPPAPPVLIQQVKTGTQSPAPAPSETQVSTVSPEVDIWAVPERVPLGTRTSVFWNTKGVESCTVTSPDGSFNESTLSGGASTVPLTGPTTFTISCLTPGGTPVTDYVIVNLTI